MMNSMQNHPQQNPHRPQYGYSRQHQYYLPPPPRSKPRQHQRGSLQRIEKNSLNVPKNRSEPKQPRKPRLRQKGSNSRPSPRCNSFSSPQSQRSPFEGPKANDVVCLSISSPTQTVVAIQPNSTHEGNLRFSVVARNYANYLKRVTTVVTNNSSSSSSLNSASKNIQKQVALSIVAEIQARGGRFLVYVKKNKNLNEHTNNGSWTLVDEENVCNLSRYALLKEAEALKKEAHPEVKVEIKPSAPNRREPLIACSEHKSSEPEVEIEDSTLPTVRKIDSDNSINRSDNSCTILNMLSGMNVDSNDDSLDVWSSSPVRGDTTPNITDCEEHAAVRLEAHCWEYKLLLPQTM